MKESEKKLLVFKRDCNEGEVLGEVCYVKFLNTNKTHAIFYRPLIAPKYFKEYINQNKIEEAYEIMSDDVLDKCYKRIYTLKSEGGVYVVNKGVDITEKLVLLVDNGMEIDVELPKFSYVLKGKTIILRPYKKNKENGYCYVSTPDFVNEDLRKIMISTEEVVPNILNLGSYSLSGVSKKKSK